MKVKEVISFLQHFDPEMEVISCGPDCGGYDCELGVINNMCRTTSGNPYICHQDPSLEDNDPIVFNVDKKS